LYAGFLLAMPNPASVYCVKQGGLIDIRADKNGNQSGICVFEENGTKSECEEWQFFQKKCAPGDCVRWSIEDHRCESKN
jgi:putative hemolysin